MTNDEIKQTLAAHAAWLRGEPGGKMAILRGAYLSRADLSRLDLTGMDLTGANLSGANLTEATGVRYVAVTAHWHGERGCQLLAVDHGDEGVVIHCGCFRGSWEELDAYIEEGAETLRESRREIARILRMLWDHRLAQGGDR